MESKTLNEFHVLENTPTDFAKLFVGYTYFTIYCLIYIYAYITSYTTIKT